MKQIHNILTDRHELTLLWSLILRRFKEDQCLRIAASLSYTSLLSLVPLMAISFAIFAAFPAFDGLQKELQSYVFDNFMPAAGNTVSQYLDTFTEKTGGMTTMGIIGLGVTAIMLLATIEDALNRIFRVREKRPLVARLMMFWALLTLGPLLMGASLSLSTYFYAMDVWTDFAGVSESVSSFGKLVLPNILMIVGLTSFYIFVPNRSISWKNALIGGTFSGVMFAVLKLLFGLYVSHFPSYQALYGVLAIIPIFLIWMYLTWAVVLMGALLTSALQDWGQAAFREGKIITPADKMAAALHALSLLKKQHAKGGALDEKVLNRELGAHVSSVVLKALDGAGFIAPTHEDHWVLARDLNELSLAEVHDSLDLNLSNTDASFGKSLEAIEQAETKRRDAMNVKLADVIG